MRLTEQSCKVWITIYLRKELFSSSMETALAEIENYKISSFAATMLSKP